MPKPPLTHSVAAFTLWQKSCLEPELPSDLTQFAVQTQPRYCCPPCGREAHQRSLVSFPAEMILPVLSTRMEQSRRSTSHGIKSRGTIRLRKIAASAGQRAIGFVVRPAKSDGNDMLQMKTVAAGVCGARQYSQLPSARISIRARRLLDRTIGPTGNRFQPLSLLRQKACIGQGKILRLAHQSLQFDPLTIR